MTAAVLLALAVCGATAVEMVEALTIVLAAGVSRGWRSAIEGAVVAVVTLAVLVGAVGVPLVRVVPIDVLRVVIGALLLVLGLGWLRKAILRASGHKAMHDEDAIFAATVRDLAVGDDVRPRRDATAFVVSFKGVLLEGLEVVLIVLSLGSSTHRLGLAAAVAGATVVVVAGIGIAVGRQLSEVPENTMKLVVGIMLSSFGLFWIAEGAGVHWPGRDLSILALVAFVVLWTRILIGLMRRIAPEATPAGHAASASELPSR